MCFALHPADVDWTKQDIPWKAPVWQGERQAIHHNHRVLVNHLSNETSKIILVHKQDQRKGDGGTERNVAVLSCSRTLYQLSCDIKSEHMLEAGSLSTRPSWVGSSWCLQHQCSRECYSNTSKQVTAQPSHICQLIPSTAGAGWAAVKTHQKEKILAWMWCLGVMEMKRPRMRN